MEIGLNIFPVDGSAAVRIAQNGTKEAIERRVRLFEALRRKQTVKDDVLRHVRLGLDNKGPLGGLDNNRLRMLGNAVGGRFELVDEQED